jgi:hypothetical protein
MKTHSSIELLEARIAPAAILHYTDVDGDLVTIKCSKVTQAQLAARQGAIMANMGGLGNQLGNFTLGPEFDGADISITARPQDVGQNGTLEGDGFVNVGAIDIGNHKLGRVTVHGDLGRIVAGDGSNTTQQLKSLTVQSLGMLGTSTGAPDLSSSVSGNVGKVVIKGDIRNAAFLVGDASLGKLGSISIGGDIVSGSVAARDGIHSLGVGGSVLGGTISSATGSLGSVKIGGSFINGAIIAGTNIGTIVIKGSLVGSAGAPARIYALGLVGDPVKHNVAIKSIKILGRVEQTWILAGVNTGGAGLNGNAQIGTVSVGGDWIASNLVSGCTTTDGTFGDANDAAIAGGTMSRIAKIVIKGQVYGEVGTTHTFGFFAESIGSFKSGVVAFHLKSGARNDGFGNGHALAVGNSITTGGAFAVHVYEV